MRKLIGLMTLMAALAAFAVSASGAAAGEVAPAEPSVANGEVVIVPFLTIEAGMSPLVKGECSEATVCAWQTNDYKGNFSYWPESQTYCHNHSENAYIRSGWNRTPHVVFYGAVEVPPHEGFYVRPEYNAITGEICW